MGDWLGPLRPGSGAWDENALDVATWKISIPGHWLHVGRGILNTSPVYFFALIGLLSLARLRDRRILIVFVLFAATAGINGLHTLWVFGHDLPGRFYDDRDSCAGHGPGLGPAAAAAQSGAQLPCNVGPCDQPGKRNTYTRSS